MGLGQAQHFEETIVKEQLDLVLLSDEPIAWEGDYWFRSDEKVSRQMRSLGLTSADKERIEQQYGIKDYLRPLPNPPGSDPSEQFFRIRVPHRPHLSLCDLATVAATAEYNVRVLDNILRFPSRMEQVKSILAKKPLAVGISTTFFLTKPLLHHYVEQIKELAPESKIILGGPSIRKFRTLHDIADFAVFGDGEEAIIAILEVLHGKRAPETVANSAYKGDDGKLHYGINGEAACRLGQNGKPFLASQVKIPVADWRLVNRSYNHVYPIEFSRGCQKNCFYCSYDRGKTIRDLDGIKRELLDNAELGITRYRISDSNFTDGPPHYPDYPEDICKLMIDLDLGLQWSCYARVDDITDKRVELMRRAGCFAVFFGIESGDDFILKKMNKMHNVADAYKGVNIAKKHDIFCHASFIVGYPGETRVTFENTLEFIMKSRPNTVNLGQFRVEHDTIAYAKKDFQVEGLGMTWTHHTMTSEEADRLVVEGNKRLLENDVCLGTECGFPTFMGLGLSVEESYQTMLDLDIIGREHKRSDKEFQEASARLKDLILNRFPQYIQDDQEAWKAASS
jgi:radical SAM superfamily enzyme YgiQ (UPF0313 family)